MEINEIVAILASVMSINLAYSTHTWLAFHTNRQANSLVTESSYTCIWDFSRSREPMIRCDPCMSVQFCIDHGIAGATLQ